MRGIGGHGIVEHLADRQRAEILAAQLARQVIGERLFQPVMLQDGGMDEARQGRLAPGHGFGLLAQGGPDRIDGGDFFARAGHDDVLKGGAFTTEVCRISKRPKLGLFSAIPLKISRFPSLSRSRCPTKARPCLQPPCPRCPGSAADPPLRLGQGDGQSRARPKSSSRTFCRPARARPITASCFPGASSSLKARAANASATSWPR